MFPRKFVTLSFLCFISSFTSMACTYDVNGKITINGSALEGVTLTLSGAANTTTASDSDGAYTFSLIQGQTYTITPSLNGHLFSPENRTITLPAGGVSGQNFIAAVNSLISGSALSLGNPKALIVTTEALSESFEKLAVLHTTTGLHTEVVTIEDICMGGCNDLDPLNDTAKAIKDYLMIQTDLEYVILGGDIEDVPSRGITDSIFFQLVYFGQIVWEEIYIDEPFDSDYYYADFDEWDPDGDGVYAEEEEETSDHRSEIAISRIPVSTPAGVLSYYDKVRRYISEYDRDDMKKAIMQTGIFNSFPHPLTGEMMDISSAYYAMERGRSIDIMSESFEVTKQYQEANPLPDPDPGVEYYYYDWEFLDTHLAHLMEGYNIVRYSDHGLHDYIAPGFYDYIAYALENQTLPIILSDTCYGAQFGYDYYDTAGEQVIKAPNGGAIVYHGQGSVGNSLLGCSQLMDEMQRYIAETENPIFGDALSYAHDVLLDVDDTFIFRFSKLGFPFWNVTRTVMSYDNYKYAQKSAVTLGDLLIPVWNDEFDPFVDIDVVKENTDSGIELTLTPIDVISNAPVVYADGDYYTFDTVGTSFEVSIADDPSEIFIGVASTCTQYYFAEVE